MYAAASAISPAQVEEEPPPDPILPERIKAGIERLKACDDAMAYIEYRGWSPKIIDVMGLILEEWRDARWIGYPWRQKGQRMHPH